MATKKSKKKSASQVQDTPVLVHGFKGFDRNWQCRGKQYAPNSSHEELGAKLCNNGLHFCEHPLDCFGYYAPGSGSVYAEVSAENPTEEKGDDTKRVTKKLHIGAELTLSSLTQAALKFVFDRATWVNGDKATGDQGAASATGDRGAASATGDRGAAAATGYLGAASATGDLGAAAATGYLGAASATGDRALHLPRGTKVLPCQPVIWGGRKPHPDHGSYSRNATITVTSWACGAQKSTARFLSQTFFIRFWMVSLSKPKTKEHS